MLSIGDLSRRTGVKVPTIRYYEQIGLIEAQGRTSGNQRRFGLAGLERLEFIRHARDLGLPLDAIRTLLSLNETGAQCDATHAIASTHLADVRSRISRLQRLEAELSRITRACDPDGTGPCGILEALGDHGRCHGTH
ncbi:MerR family transcriptional regulator [Mesobaculum littorinae]|uniref:MerR family transcriptional regulator n=1 Tax=Mesobaculum littorinae TaxID=2486419 RepID=A0A438AED4_9RHOB|nr:helix-turn-helix domain-containing protein [Mesobaculum littorinae]RVV97028.1 MerR family transcriptional regulator [Mesobaculum littorinae]